MSACESKAWRRSCGTRWQPLRSAPIERHSRKDETPLRQSRMVLRPPGHRAIEAEAMALCELCRYVAQLQCRSTQQCPQCSKVRNANTARFRERRAEGQSVRD
jgi:hypothetical protein